jgi:hypothetical protein
MGRRFFLLVPALAMKVKGGLVLPFPLLKKCRLIFLFLKIDNFWIYFVCGWVMAVAGSVGQAAVDIDDDWGALGRVARAEEGGWVGGRVWDGDGDGGGGGGGGRGDVRPWPRPGKV